MFDINNESSIILIYELTAITQTFLKNIKCQNFLRKHFQIVTGIHWVVYIDILKLSFSLDSYKYDCIFTSKNM